MNYFWLSILTIIAIDWLIRMVVYYNTGNEACKHKYIWWKVK